MEHRKTASPVPPTFVVRHVFEDVDELAEVARAWDLDFRQLHRGKFRGSLVQAGTDRRQLARTRLQGVLHRQGTTPAGLYTFAVYRARHIKLEWRGHTIGPDEILVHRPFGESHDANRYRHWIAFNRIV